MLNRKYALLAGAVFAATPLVSKAAVLSFTYDPNDFEISTDGGTTYNTLPAADLSGNTLTIPQGSIVTFGIDASAGTSNANSTVAYHGVYDTTKTPTNIQPQYLGIASFGFGFTDSKSSIATLDDSSYGINTEFASPGAGGSDGSGGAPAASLSGTFVASGVSATSAAAVKPLAWGASGGPTNANSHLDLAGNSVTGSTGELLFNLAIDAGNSNGTAVFTPVQQNGSFAYTQYNSGGTSSTSKPVYKNITVGSTTDVAFVGAGGSTVNALPALTVIVGSAVVSTHSIVSLTTGTTPTGSYGNADGTITMTGSNSSYVVTPAAGFTTATTGSVVVTGFNPASDQEVYALKLSQNGSAGSITNTVALAEIAADINGANGNSASAGVSASLITGVYSTLFPAGSGYDLLLTSAPGFLATGGANLGFDFSAGGGQQDASALVGGVAVTGIAAVPEPATTAGIIIGAAGLLLGRRKSRALVA